MNGAPTAKPTPPLLIALAWAFVSVPWLWGIFETLRNAMKLFE